MIGTPSPTLENDKHELKVAYIHIQSTQHKSTSIFFGH